MTEQLLYTQTAGLIKNHHTTRPPHLMECGQTSHEIEVREGNITMKKRWTRSRRPVHTPCNRKHPPASARISSSPTHRTTIRPILGTQRMIGIDLLYAPYLKNLREIVTVTLTREPNSLMMKNTNSCPNPAHAQNAAIFATTCHKDGQPKERESISARIPSISPPVLH